MDGRGIVVDRFHLKLGLSKPSVCDEIVTLPAIDVGYVIGRVFSLPSPIVITGKKLRSIASSISALKRILLFGGNKFLEHSWPQY